MSTLFRRFPFLLELHAIAVLPVLTGMFLGNRLGGLFDPATFQRFVMVVPVLAGLNIVRKGGGSRWTARRF